MEFAKIIKHQATHKLMHVRGEKGGENHQDLSCQTCYLTKDVIKHKAFNRFWKIIDQIELSIETYSG